MKWRKEDTFDPFSYTAKLFDQIISNKLIYSDTETNAKLIIFKSFDGKNWVQYDNPSPELEEEFNQKKEIFQPEYHQDLGTRELAPIIIGSPNVTRIGMQGTQDKGQVFNFIELIDQHNSLTEIKNEIFAFIGPRPEELIRRDVEAYLNRVNSDFLPSPDVSTAMEVAIQAQKEGYYEVIWYLVNKLEERMWQQDPNEQTIITPQLIYDLYDEITKNEDNPHCKEAYSKKFDILETQSPSEEEIDLHNAEKLTCAIESGRSKNADFVFAYMCGEKGQPTIQNVGTPESLVSIAKNIKGYKEENKNLTEENEKLKLELAKLKAGIEAEKRVEKRKKQVQNIFTGVSEQDTKKKRF